MAENDSQQRQFKVLIAGGSLVGLGLALALQKAGIDYELFEKGQFAPQLGASFGLYPHSLRILDQLGVWEDIRAEVLALTDRVHFDENGRCFENSQALVEVNKIVPRPTMFMERSRALEILYGHILEKSRLHAHNGVVGYEETDDGVTVTTQNGETHHGDILVGADGIHSTVRRLMAEKSGNNELIEGFTSEYNCLFAISKNDPANPFSPDATVHNAYFPKYSGITATGVPGLIFWFFFVKAAAKTRTPNCPRFTDEDAEALAKEYGSAELGPGYTVRDLWETRIKGNMSPLEEGVLKKWSHGRVTLMGDAIHKVTINAGLGGNLGYEGIAHLTNALIPLLKDHPIPSTEQITGVFNQYYNHHSPRANIIQSFSAYTTRSEAQDTWFHKFMAQNIVPLISDKTKAGAFAKFYDASPWLEWTPLPAVDIEVAETRKKEKEATDRKYGWVSTIGTVAAAVGVGAVVWKKYGSKIVELASQSS